MTDNSRRRFVVGGLAVVASAGLAGCNSASDSGSVVTPIAGPTPSGTASTTPLIASEPSEWDKLVGSSFLITAGTAKVSAVLARLERIADASRPANLARREPFYAVFEMNAAEVPAGGATYALSHATRGDFDLFLGMSSVVGGKGVLTALLN